MAPRAGFEVDCNYMMPNVHAFVSELRTPSDTPQSEHLICNQGVADSSPSAGTNFRIPSRQGNFGIFKHTTMLTL